MTNEDWAKVLDTSLNGFMYTTRSVLKPMLTKKRGRIINMVSLSGLKGLPGQTNYSAAKGAVISATKALAQEVARKGVTVNAVAPGFVRTDMTQDLDEATLKAQIPMGRFGEPEHLQTFGIFLTPLLVSDSEELQVEGFGVSHLGTQLTPLGISRAIGKLNEVERILHERLQVIYRAVCTLVVVLILAGQTHVEDRQRLGTNLLTHEEVLVETEISRSKKMSTPLGLVNASQS